MVRKFYLENEKGQKFSLIDIDNDCFFSSPSGLGYSYSNTYEQVGNTYVKNVGKLEQGNIFGELIFKNYDNYIRLVNFIESSNDLKFIYQIPFSNATVKYYKDIDLQNLEKTEKLPNGLLSCPTSIYCKTLWYKENDTVYSVNEDNNDIRWNFKWDSAFNDYSVRGITFENSGHVKAPIQVEISGYVENPGIEVVVNGKIYESIRIPIIINEYEKFLYSSKDGTGNIYIRKQKVNGTFENLFKNKYIDLNNNNIFKLPLGISTVRLVADNDINNAKLRILTQYKAV